MGKKKKKTTYQQSVTVFIAFHFADNHINPMHAVDHQSFAFTTPWEIITKLVQQVKAQSSYCICYLYYTAALPKQQLCVITQLP